MAVTWDEGKLWQQEELDEIVTVGNGNGITIQQEGNAPRLLEQRTDVTVNTARPLGSSLPRTTGSGRRSPA